VKDRKERSERDRGRAGEEEAGKRKGSKNDIAFSQLWIVLDVFTPTS